MRKGIIDSIDNSQDLQVAQVSGLATEQLDSVEVLGSYGFSSHPKKYDSGSDQGAVCAFSRNASGTTVVTAIDDPRFRPIDLQEGEVCLYGFNDKTQPHRIIIKADGSTEIKNNTVLVKIQPDGTIAINASTINISGNVNVTGTLTASFDVVGGGKSLKNHTHSGVQSGGSNTGVPN